MDLSPFIDIVFSMGLAEERSPNFIRHSLTVSWFIRILSPLSSPYYWDPFLLHPPAFWFMPVLFGYFFKVLLHPIHNRIS